MNYLMKSKGEKNKMLGYFIIGLMLGLGLGCLIGCLIGYKLCIKDDELIKELKDKVKEKKE